jgi:outer membrane protein assembly factor BamE (lipoprotein component of BamABCDE complex)
MQLKLICIFLSFIFFLSFQAFSEETFKEETLTLGTVQLTLKKGITQTEVAEALGSPNMVSRGKKGKETWIYDKLSTEISNKKTKKGFDIGASVEIGDATVGGGYADSEKTQTTHRSQKTLTVILKFIDGELDDYSYKSTSF